MALKYAQRAHVALTNMLQTKDTRLHIRTSTEQIERLKRAAEIVEVSASDFARKAIEKELARMARQYPELAKQAA